MLLTYRNYLSQNKQIVPELMNRTAQGGECILVTAGCGSGKTHLMLVELASEAAKIGKRVILTVPTSLQAEQNAVYKYQDKNENEKQIVPITGTARNLILDNADCCCSVYDLNTQLLDLPDYALKNVIFVIDEAHQLQTALNYRKIAIANTLKVADKIRTCGGTVIFMTGTPRRLDGYSFDERINCIRVDENGHRVPQVNFKDLTIYSRETKRLSFEDCTTNLIMDLLHQGKHPMVRVNDKDMIRRLSLQLLKEGYTVKELTSADKTCALIDGRKRYLSDTYESIVESHVLPDADCYLVTSVLEVGTSITGIMRNGKEVKDPSLTPVCVVSKSTQFDLDEVAQFLARPRFAIDRAYLLLNFTADPTNRNEGKDKGPRSLNSYIFQITSRANTRQYSLNHDFSGMEFNRSLVTSLKGEDERKDLCFDARTKQWALDKMAIQNEACRKYDMERYIRRGNVLISALGDLFQIEKDRIHFESCPLGASREKVVLGALPESFTQDIQVLLNNHKVVDSLTRSIRPELAGMDELFQFSKKTYQCSSGISVTGNELLARICKHTINGVYSMEQAIEIVRRQYETGSINICMEPNPDENSVPCDPYEFAASIIALQMAREPLDKRNYLLWYYEAHYCGKDISYASASKQLKEVFGEADAKKYMVLFGSHYFSTIYQAYSLVRGHMDLPQLLAQPFADTEEGALNWIYQVYFAELNTRPRSWIQTSDLQSTAEYAILTDLGCYIPDYNFEEQRAKGNRKAILELGSGNISFRDFDRNKEKVLDMRALTWIAMNMVSSMRTHKRKGYFTGSYTAKDILTLLKRIYSYEFLYDRNGKFRAIMIVHPRTKPYARANKDKRLKFLDEVLADSSHSMRADTRQYAIDQAEAGLKKICYGRNRKMIPQIMDLLKDMMHLKDGIIQNDFQPDKVIYSFTAEYYPSFYVDHSLQVLYALFSEHPELVGQVSTFTEVVSGGTYEMYCQKLGLATDKRLNCVWTTSPSMAAPKTAA